MRIVGALGVVLAGLSVIGAVTANGSGGITSGLADSNSAGWLTRFFLSPLMPF